MENQYDRAITQEQRQRLAVVSNKDIHFTFSAMFVTAAITALSLFLLRF